jgi:cold shock CspA family protein
MALHGGKMIWFNEAKGYGFIRTEDDERLYVAASGFACGSGPAGRCAGLPVVFRRQTLEGDPRAVDVSIVEDVEAPRARLRSHRGGRSL